MNRRLAMLGGLAAALALAAWSGRGPDADDEDLVAAVPRSGAVRPAGAPSAPGSPPARVAPALLASAAPPTTASDALRGVASDALREPIPSGTPLRTSLRASADLFPVPPAPRVAASPPPPPPPPPPVAPRPRFVLIGRLVDAKGPMAILRDGEQVLTLRAGERVSGFLMTAIADDAAGFVHEPTGQAVRIAFAGGRPTGRAAGAAVAAAPVEEESPSAD